MAAPAALGAAPTHLGAGAARRREEQARPRAAREAGERDDEPAPLAEEGAEAWVLASDVLAGLPEVGENYHVLRQSAT